MTETSKTGRSSSLLSLVGWVLSAMSLLNLINDIGRIAVFGKLKTWLDAYALFVEALNRFVFGWIRFGWISISPGESHVLVVAALLCSAVFRAYYVDMRDELPRRTAILFASILVSIYFCFALIPALLFAGNWGVGFSIFGLLIPAVLTLIEPDRNLEWPFVGGAVVRRELYGVLGVFLVLLAANYSIFRTDGG